MTDFAIRSGWTERGKSSGCRRESQEASGCRCILFYVTENKPKTRMKTNSKIALAVLLVGATVSFAEAQTDFESVHNLRRISNFNSIQEITNHFAKARVPIEILEL